MVTPVVLTFNEEHNIQSTLASLSWAERVVVLDSGSVDKTQTIARSFRNVAFFERPFDDHKSQWSYAIHQTQILTPYVLALDADMRPSTGFEAELARMMTDSNLSGAWIPFEYRILGRSLFGSIYPPQIRLFRRERIQIDQPGHTQVFSATGPLYHFRSKLIHEDRKPLTRWLDSQIKYAQLEATRIRSTAHASPKDRLRLLGISPAIWGVYAYLRAGGPLNAPVARAYAHERLIFEALLARILSEPKHD